MWLYHIGPQWAKRLLFTGDCISGEDAARIGLALKALDSEDLDSEVEGFMNRLGHVDYELLAAQKRLINFGLQLMGAQTALDSAAEINAAWTVFPYALISQGDATRECRRCTQVRVAMRFSGVVWHM